MHPHRRCTSQYFAILTTPINGLISALHICLFSRDVSAFPAALTEHDQDSSKSVYVCVKLRRYGVLLCSLPYAPLRASSDPAEEHPGTRHECLPLPLLREAATRPPDLPIRANEVRVPHHAIVEPELLPRHWPACALAAVGPRAGRVEVQLGEEVACVL